MTDRLFILNASRKQREVFDPKNKSHLEELKFFLENKKWKNGCPFYLEHPYLEIPAMTSQRFLEHCLS
jgi:hypothetical protein